MPTLTPKSEPGVLPECHNCLQPMVAPRSTFLFCGEHCKQEARYVRQARSVQRDRSRRTNLLTAEALEFKRTFILLGHAYPARKRRLTDEQRAAVFVRDESRCYVCGGSGTQIDHVGTGIEGDVNHPDNLRAVCDGCHRGKTKDSFARITKAEHPELWERVQQEIKALEVRVGARMPSRPCDNQETWNGQWPALAKERTSQLAARPVLSHPDDRYGPMCTPSGKQWVVAEYAVGHLDGYRFEHVQVVDFLGKFNSFQQAQETADDYASDLGQDAVEELMLAQGLLPGDNPSLMADLSSLLDQPDPAAEL